jgi:prophage tail gpP-like protein
MFNATQVPLPGLVDGAKGEIFLDDQLAGTIRIDTRTSQGTPQTYTLTLAFRGLSSSIVDSHADHPSGQENKKTPGQISKKLMEGHDSQLEDQSGESQQLERYIIDEGETIARGIRRATREFGLVASENPQGNVVLAKRGHDQGGMGHPLILGKNFIQWSTKRDMAPRNQKTKTKGNAVPTDKKYGKDAEEMAGQAIDNYVKFKKEQHVLIDSDHSKDTLKKRAVTEARRRASQGLNIELTLSTWSDDGGQLWAVGKSHMVVIPVDGISDLLVISQVEFTLDKEKRETRVTLVPKESFGDESGSGGDSGGASGKGGGGGNQVMSPDIQGSVDSG